MTRLTAILIAGSENVYASFYGPKDGKFGLYIDMDDETPSGCKRPRALLTSEPIYRTGPEAKKAAEDIIADVKKNFQV